MAQLHKIIAPEEMPVRQVHVPQAAAYQEVQTEAAMLSPVQAPNGE